METSLCKCWIQKNIRDFPNGAAFIFTVISGSIHTTKIFHSDLVKTEDMLAADAYNRYSRLYASLWYLFAITPGNKCNKKNFHRYLFRNSSSSNA